MTPFVLYAMMFSNSLFFTLMQFFRKSFVAVVYIASCLSRVAISFSITASFIWNSVKRGCGRRTMKKKMIKNDITFSRVSSELGSSENVRKLSVCGSSFNFNTPFLR